MQVLHPVPVLFLLVIDHLMAVLLVNGLITCRHLFPSLTNLPISTFNAFLPVCVRVFWLRTSSRLPLISCSASSHDRFFFCRESSRLLLDSRLESIFPKPVLYFGYFTGNDVFFRLQPYAVLANPLEFFYLRRKFSHALCSIWPFSLGESLIFPGGTVQIGIGSGNFLPQLSDSHRVVN